MIKRVILGQFSLTHAATFKAPSLA